MLATVLAVTTISIVLMCVSLMVTSVLIKSHVQKTDGNMKVKKIHNFIFIGYENNIFPVLYICKDNSFIIQGAFRITSWKGCPL